MEGRILEIFKSIQGEGLYAGVMQIFVRFFECNMHCVWCDTPASIGHQSQNFKAYNGTALNQEIHELRKDCHSISITGGEPLLQAKFIKFWLQSLDRQNLKIYLDTNGTLPQELAQVISLIDIIAMDMELPSSTEQRSYWEEHKQFLKIACEREVFVKTVISLKTEKEDFVKAVNCIREADECVPLIIQPNSYEIQQGVVEKCISFYNIALKDLKHVRLLPQTHKMMKIR